MVEPILVAVNLWNGKLQIKRERGRMLTIKHKIETGQYKVDPGLVAEAMLKGARASREAAQKECSNPASGSSQSTNATSGGPSFTEPTQLSLGLAPSH